MRVLHVGAEIFPLLKTGGLADLLGALPGALVRAGADARVLLPAFPALLAALRDVRDVGSYAAPWGGVPARLLAGCFEAPSLAGVPVYLLHHDALYGRSGNPYHDAVGTPYPDNHRRFALLGLAASRLAVVVKSHGAKRAPAERATALPARPFGLEAASLTDQRKKKIIVKK